MFCVWSSLKISRGPNGGNVFEAVWKNLGDLVWILFWSNLKEWRSTFSFVFEVAWNLKGSLCVWSWVFERILCFVIEVVWKNLRDSLYWLRSKLKKSRGTLVFCFWSSLKEFRRSLVLFFMYVVWTKLVPGFWSCLIESRGPLLYCFWSNLKESWGSLLCCFCGLFEIILGIPYHVFELVWKNLRIAFALFLK